MCQSPTIDERKMKITKAQNPSKENHAAQRPRRPKYLLVSAVAYQNNSNILLMTVMSQDSLALSYSDQNTPALTPANKLENPSKLHQKLY